MPKPRTVIGLLAVALAVGLSALMASTAQTSSAVPASSARTCAFSLRIGDVLPFTGDLAAYGANLDRAVKLAVSVQNAALRKLRLSKRIKSTLVDSQDGQTQATASVEAATKEVKSEHVNVVIGEMASSATIPMAQSVTIPNHVVTISPTSSAPQISAIRDNGYLWRVYPSDTLQGRVLALAAIQAFGKGATINVGSRNDAFGQALRKLFVAQYKKLGGKVGVNISWNPDQSTFDTEAQQLVSGNP
jgi:branched-chain amino acid transport system substrate-binding protein